MYQTCWSRELRKWIVSIALSFSIIALAMMTLYQSFQQDRCLDSGGRWLGAVKGCDFGTYEDYYFVITPTATIALAIIWVVLSWLISLVYAKVVR